MQTKLRLGKCELDPLNCETNEEEKDPLACSICKRYFSHKTNSLQHECTGAAEKKEILSFEIKHGHIILDQHDFEVINASTNASTL